MIQASKLLLLSFLFIGLAVNQPESLQAQVRLESICTVEGHEDIRLIGTGLVVGLAGTGDSGNGPSIRALASMMKGLNSPVLDPKELVGTKNAAIVMVYATIPKTGSHKGTYLDCYISSHGNATSLRGGHLLITPLIAADRSSDVVVGSAGGRIVIEDALQETTGRIRNGVIIKDSFFQSERYLSKVVNTKGSKPKIRLLIDRAHSSFITARLIAELINESLGFESYDQEMAKALSPSIVEVQIPQHMASTPVDFIADVLEYKINSPHSISQVLVNTKTGVVIVSGDVELSPVVISHPNLQINIGGGNLPLNGATFRSLSDGQSTRASTRLDQLVKALNELGVPKEAMIEVLRELSRSGKLHAEYKEI